MACHGVGTFKTPDTLAEKGCCRTSTAVWGSAKPMSIDLSHLEFKFFQIPARILGLGVRRGVVACLSCTPLWPLACFQHRLHWFIRHNAPSTAGFRTDHTHSTLLHPRRGCFLPRTGAGCGGAVAERTSSMVGGGRTGTRVSSEVSSINPPR